MTPGLFFFVQSSRTSDTPHKQKIAKIPAFQPFLSLLLQLSYKVQNLFKFKDRYSMSVDSREYSFNTLKAKQTTVTTTVTMAELRGFFCFSVKKK